MENNKKLNAGAIVGIVILAIVSAATAFANVYLTLSAPPKFITAGAIAEIVTFLILLIAIVYYAVRGYKTPHGNLLRWTFFLFSLNCLGIMAEEIVCAYDFGLMEQKMGTVMLIVMLITVSAVLSAFISGRLDHLRGNTVCIILITAAQFMKSFLYFRQFDAAFTLNGILVNFSTFMLWLDMAFAYMLRYREHKEAGLADKN